MYYAIFTQFRDNKPVRVLSAGTFTDKQTAYYAKYECEKYDMYSDLRYLMKPTTVYKCVMYRRFDGVLKKWELIPANKIDEYDKRGNSGIVYSL